MNKSNKPVVSASNTLTLTSPACAPEGTSGRGELERNDIIIAPSILSADFARLGAEVDAVLAAGADWIHVDVMDNHFVPNLTIGPMVVHSLRDYGVTAPMDVHLMVEPVASLITPFAKAGATYITFHIEAVKNVHDMIKQIRDAGCKPGLVYNPATPIAGLENYIEELDMVLIMSVNAGFGGQKFMPEVLSKVRYARELIACSGKSIRLEIDGGISVDTIAQAAAAGADTFVVGSAMFKSTNYAKTITDLRTAI
ncbi:MAG: ribulose-phosphate 3-epimerase [Gammaproteobacteria bacterium]|nr:ribulose-phosphate 3-epimerase [Gammaproteobacteria bacterium]